MRGKSFWVGFISLAVLCTWSGVGLAAQFEDTWIFRSGVVPGQSMWGPGTQIGYNFSDTYMYQSGIFSAGFTWNLQADPGTVFGNVEGNITAKYDKMMKGLGNKTITLSYAGIPDESQIRTSLGVGLTGKPVISIDLPWPIPDINWDFGLNFLNMNTNSKTDFTTGLDSTVYDSGRYIVLPFNVDVVILSGSFNVFLDNDITFRPETITGIMKYTHMATGTERQVPVTFNADSDLLDLVVNLDLPGAWEFSLENFYLSENVFTQELDLGFLFALGVPILSANFSAEVDTIFDFGEREFSLDFLNHGFDGNDQTADRLGRFCVYVDPVPLPGTVWLLGSALAGLVGWRRKVKNS